MSLKKILNKFGDPNIEQKNIMHEAILYRIIADSIWEVVK